jgi:hypothetical protein
MMKSPVHGMMRSDRGDVRDALPLRAVTILRREKAGESRGARLM